MSRIWKRIATQSVRPGLCALLLAAWLALGACVDMPEVDAPDEAASASAMEQPATDMDADNADAADTDADGTGDVIDPVQEHMASELETETEAVADADAATPDEEVAAPAVEDWTRHFVVEGQYVYLGNPEAPVTILDVSDFL